MNKLLRFSLILTALFTIIFTFLYIEVRISIKNESKQYEINAKSDFYNNFENSVALELKKIKTSNHININQYLMIHGYHYPSFYVQNTTYLDNDEEYIINYSISLTNNKHTDICKSLENNVIFSNVKCYITKKNITVRIDKDKIKSIPTELLNIKFN